MSLKLAIIVGTRPEIIRLSQIINKARTLFDVTLIHTGQNYDYNLNQVFFDDLNIKKPEIYLDCSSYLILQHESQSLQIFQQWIYFFSP